MIKRMCSSFFSTLVIVATFLLVSSAMVSIGEAATTTATTPQAAADVIYTPRYLPNILLGAEGPADMVFLVYQYLMGLVGVVAVGVIMYGGVLRTMSADPGKIKASNDYIKNALKGIVLLFGAQVLFNTINPNIIDVERIQNALQPDVKINPPIFEGVDMGLLDGGATTTPGQQNPVDIYGGLPGMANIAARIKSCNNCADTTGSTFFVKNGACFTPVCQLNTGIIASLNNLQTSGLSWRVTEAYPPTVYHASECHYDGTCVDIALTSSATAASVDALINAAKASGFVVVNEYSVGTNPQSFETTTGGHLHIRK